MFEGLTKSEKFVNSISERAFLKLWTHPNPIGKKGKELCDCLIVCGNHIVIISVKDIDYKDTGDETGFKRWTKAAIDKSASQIWGAERWLDTAVEFTSYDGRKVKLPPKESRIIHRISVSLGAQRKIPTQSGNLGYGFVHVYDEFSVGTIFGLLDTITDFVIFLTEVEALVSGSKVVFNGGGIEDLLAIYLLNNYSFPFREADFLIVDDTVFESFIKSDDYKSMQDSFKDSYFWDKLIEHFVSDLLTDGMFEYGTCQPTDSQHALIQMAIQPRSYRAALVDAYTQFLQQPELKVAARVVLAYQNTAFVFHLGASSDREARIQELWLRCLVVRGRIPNVKIVVGISRDELGLSEVGYSHDIVYVNIPEWDDVLEEQVKKIQRELGYFESASWANEL